MPSIDIASIRKPLHNSLKSTHEKHKCKKHVDLFKFQNLYESDHNCSVLKLYSQRSAPLSEYTDIKYWESLRFNSDNDITMFILKWS